MRPCSLPTTFAVIVLAGIVPAARIVLARDAEPAHSLLVELTRNWLADPSELRVGLGCMRLSTDEDRDEELGLETIAAAVEAGITVFDTAHSYGHEGEPGHNEALLARALRRAKAEPRART